MFETTNQPINIISTSATKPCSFRGPKKKPGAQAVSKNAANVMKISFKTWEFGLLDPRVRSGTSPRCYLFGGYENSWKWAFRQRDCGDLRWFNTFNYRNADVHQEYDGGMEEDNKICWKSSQKSLEHDSFVNMTWQNHRKSPACVV